MSARNDSDDVATQHAAKFERLLGKMIASFAHFERQLKTVLAMIICGNQEHYRALALTGQVRFTQALAAFDALMKRILEADATALAKLAEWTAASEKANTQRNRYVHHALIYTVLSDGNVMSRLYQTKIDKKAGGIRGEVEVVTPEALEQLEREIEDRLYELGDMTRDLVQRKIIPSSAMNFIVQRVKKGVG